MSRTKSKQRRVRLSFEVAESTRKRLESLRDRIEAESMSEVIRRALATYEVLLDYTNDSDARIELVTKNEIGDVGRRELVLT